MYPQIIYQHEALQMPKMIKQKGLQLACKQVRYGFTKIPHIFPIEYNICIDKLPGAALYISYKKSDLHMLVTTKAFLVAITRQR